MHARFEIEKPDDVMVTMTVTMRLREWNLICAALDKGEWPMCSYAMEISAMIHAAQKTFTARMDDPPKPAGE